MGQAICFSTVNGFVVGVEIMDNGTGYQSPPQVFFLGGGGSGATGVATVQNGVVTGVKITSTGSGYTSASRVLFAEPLGGQKPRGAVTGLASLN
jgi:hypothetical protein